MKQLTILLIMIFIMNSCQSQDRIDLEQLDINIDIQTILSKIEGKYSSNQYMLWGYPSYNIHNVEDFKFGDVKFINTDDFFYDEVDFIMDPNKKNIVLVNVSINDEETFNLLEEYFHNKYKNPIILEEEPTYEMNGKVMGSSAYLCKNIDENCSLILSKQYKSKTNSMNIYIIRNKTDIVGQDYDYNDINILEYLILQHSHWPLEKIREVLQK